MGLFSVAKMAIIMGIVIYGTKAFKFINLALYLLQMILLVFTFVPMVMLIRTHHNVQYEKQKFSLYLYFGGTFIMRFSSFVIQLISAFSIYSLVDIHHLKLEQLNEMCTKEKSTLIITSNYLFYFLA